jgi:hypothetical protein
MPSSGSPSMIIGIGESAMARLLASTFRAIVQPTKERGPL